MGLKGISWFEQNVEKVVASVFGIALLGVVAMQFIGKGNQIELGATPKDKKPYALDEVWGAVNEAATATKNRIGSADPDREVMNWPEAPGVLTSFTGRLRGPVAPNPKLARVPWDRPAYAPVEGGGGIDAAQSKSEVYAAVVPPAPSQPVAAPYLATIHPAELRANEDLARLVMGDAPQKDLADGKLGALLPKLDRAVISVETSFDGTALEKLMIADPDGEGPAVPMPRHWWDSGRMQILGMEVERQEQQASGEWGAAAPVAHMPGRRDLLADVKAMASGEVKFSDILGEASKSREEIQRPKYYSIIFGEEWVPPSEYVEDLAAGAGPGGDLVAALRRQLADYDSKLATLQEEIRKLEDEIGQGRNPPAPPPGPRGNPPPGPGGKGNPGPRGPETHQPSEPPKDPKQVKLDGKRAQYAKLYADRGKVVTKLKKLGVPVDEGKEVARVAPPPKTNAEPERPLMANAALRLWTHDVNVQRGKTYRYRLTLVFNNPIYGNNAGLDPKQAELAKDPLVRSKPSEWSDPVNVDPETYYFVTSAVPEDAFARTAHATAEVFVFSAGYWRKGTSSLEPGDTIAADVRVPDPEKIMALIPPQPGEFPGVPMPVQPGGPRGVPGQADRPVVPPPPGQGEPQPIDPASVMVPKTVAQDAVLLDVASTTVATEGISKTRTENQAFMLHDDGSIVVRSPEQDRVEKKYLRLVRSAEKGEESLRPRPVAPIEPFKPINDPGKKEKKDDGGGGGGGG